MYIISSILGKLAVVLIPFVFPLMCCWVKIDAERTIKIQRENELNLEKINHIMRTTGEVDNRRYYDRKRLVQVQSSNKLYCHELRWPLKLNPSCQACVYSSM